jgi:hypothetical protein
MELYPQTYPQDLLEWGMESGKSIFKVNRTRETWSGSGEKSAVRSVSSSSAKLKTIAIVKLPEASICIDK